MKLFKKSSERFDKTEAKSARLTRKTFHQFYPIYWTGLKTLQKAVTLLIKENNELEDRQVTAILVLVNRSIQHIESMRILVEKGLYGDAFVLSRSLMSNVAMVQYLKLKPEFVEDFLKEKREDYQDRSTGFSEKFNETIIHKTLTQAGVPDFRNSFEILSKTSHASTFGSQLFGSLDKGSQFHLKYGPGFEFEKALGALAIISAGHFDMIDNVLRHRREKAPTSEWLEIEQEFLKLNKRIDLFSKAAMRTVETIVNKKRKQV